MNDKLTSQEGATRQLSDIMRQETHDQVDHLWTFQKPGYSQNNLECILNNKDTMLIIELKLILPAATKLGQGSIFTSCPCHSVNIWGWGGSGFPGACITSHMDLGGVPGLVWRVVYLVWSEGVSGIHPGWDQVHPPEIPGYYPRDHGTPPTLGRYASYWTRCTPILV